MVALLAKNQADIMIKDVEGSYFQLRSTEVHALFLSYCEIASGFTALHVAAQFGCTPVVAFLIATGQPIDCPDETRMTAAMWAAYKVKIL